MRRAIRVRHTPPEPLNAANRPHVQFNMKHFIGILPLLLILALMVGCASDFQSTDSGSSAANDSPPDTSIQDSIDRMNQQMATDAANAAAQQQFLAGMAAAQETMNNANNNQATSNW
jgi:predicted lipid-binding transport protein (Tim44 family)